MGDCRVPPAPAPKLISTRGRGCELTLVGLRAPPACDMRMPRLDKVRMPRHACPAMRIVRHGVESMYVDVLRDKRAEVLADIEGLRAQASEVAGRLAAKEGQLRNLDDLLMLETGHPDARPESAATGPRPQSTKTQRFTDAAVEILAERGEPIHYLELTRLLGDGGVYVPGKEPGANLIAHMLRDDRFTRAPARGTYGLAEWPGMREASQGSRRTRGVRRRTRTRAPRRTGPNG